MNITDIPAAVWATVIGAWLAMTGWFMRRHFGYGERLGKVEEKVDGLHELIVAHTQDEDQQHNLIITMIQELVKSNCRADDGK